jgi:predicted lipoprotein with Yx(FWY)xxD motif
MRPFAKIQTAIAAVAFIGAAGTIASAQTFEKYRPPVPAVEVSLEEPRPPDFGVQPTDVDGPVFVDSRGMTLYIWPYRNMELGGAGDYKDKPSTCTDTKFTETSGRMSIYTGGMILPDLDIRPTCLEAWPAVFAAPDAKPVGKWTVSVRSDGRKQWAYDGMPLYTSALDK